MHAPAAAAVPKLAFSVAEAGAQPYAAVPTLRFAVRIAREGGGPIRSLALDVQVRIAAPRRAYDAAERERLRDLFGTHEQWSSALKSLLWTTGRLVAGPFEDETTAELTVPCTYDFEVAATRYLHALGDGAIPLELLFSGTAFHAAPPDGRLQATRVSWESEAACELPVAEWRRAMDAHFPGAAWLRVNRGAFEKLLAYRTRHALTSWEATFDALLEDRG